MQLELAEQGGRELSDPPAVEFDLDQRHGSPLAPADGAVALASQPSVGSWM